MKPIRLHGIRITNDQVTNISGAPDLLEPYHNIAYGESYHHKYSCCVHDDDIAMTLVSGNSHEMPTYKAWWYLNTPTRDNGVTFNAIPQYFKIKPRMSYGEPFSVAPGQNILFVQLQNAEDGKSAWFMQYLGVVRGLYGYVLNIDA